MDEGDLAMASHLADWAVAADPHNAEAQRVRADVYSRRAHESRATMTRGIFRAAAWDSNAALEGLKAGEQAGQSSDSSAGPD